MKNTITDLRNHLFEQIEKISDANTPEDQAKEIEKAKAIKDLAQVIVNSAKVEVDFLKKTGRENPGTTFIPLGDETPVKRLEVNQK